MVYLNSLLSIAKMYPICNRKMIALIFSDSLTRDAYCFELFCLSDTL